MQLAVSLVALIVGLARGQQLQLPAAPVHVPEACSDLNHLFDTVGSLDAECCGPSGNLGCEVPISTCSTRCAAAVVPLVDRCGTILFMFLPDDEVDILASLRHRCEANVTSVAALAELKQRVQDGVCSDDALEGVAVAHVPAARCIDARDKCEAGITSGFVSCATDFCLTCPSAGECDATCDLCGHGDGGNGQGNGKRRTQMTCPLDVFTTEANEVTHACCDPGTGGCKNTGSPPAECDARCGIVYLDFFRTCGGGIRTFMPTEYQAYVRLESTCEHLPVLPMLELLSGVCYVPPHGPWPPPPTPPLPPPPPPALACCSTYQYSNSDCCA